jgi:hypothetical protein
LSSPTSFQSIPSQSALNYVTDALNDFTVPADSNSGLTSTALTNPTNSFFGNDNSVRYKAKTLWVDNLVLEEDKTKWINGKPTYKIIWNQLFPAAVGYVCGEIDPRQAGSFGKYFKLLGNGDIFGVTGVIRKCSFLVQPSSTGTTPATIFVDGVSDVSITVKQRPLLPDTKQKALASYVNTSQQTHDIHDYQLRNTGSTTGMTVVGVIVYYEIDGLGVDVAGGDTYLNRERITSVGTSLAVPTVTSGNGAVSSVYIQSTSSFGVTTVQVPDIGSRASGSATTNQLVVDTGLGASFPVGSLVYMPGTTNYFGNVLSVSTDTLVMGVTLPVNYTFATLSIIGQAGPTFAIGSSLYDQKFEITFDTAFAVNNSNGGGAPLLFYSSPNLDWRVWGGTIGTSFSSGVKVISCVSGNVLHVDGNFDALKFTYTAGATTGAGVHATYNIDGLDCFNSLEAIPYSSDITRNILTNAGIGFHTVTVSFGASTVSTGLSRITGYRRTSGTTLGVLSDIVTGQTFISRNIIGATSQVTAIGPVRRVYSDSLEFSSGWVSGLLTGGDGTAGGAVYYATSAAQSLRLGYYGKAFAILGSITGGSFSLSVDSAPQVLAPMNTWIGTTLTEGFHVLDIVPAGQTLMISAIDYQSAQVGVIDKQRFYGQEVSGENKQSIEKDVWGRLQITNRSIDNLNRKSVYTGTSVGIGGLAVGISLISIWGAGVGATLDLNSTVYVTTTGNPVRVKTIANINNITSAEMSSIGVGGAQVFRFSLYRAIYARGGSLIQDTNLVTGNLFRATGSTVFSWSPYFLDVLDYGLAPGLYAYYLGFSAVTGTSFAVTTNGMFLSAKEEF